MHPPSMDINAIPDWSSFVDFAFAHASPTATHPPDLPMDDLSLESLPLSDESSSHWPVQCTAMVATDSAFGDNIRQDILSISKDDTKVAISNTFHFDYEVGGQRWDTLLLSHDHVYFTCHREKLLSISTNAFGGLLCVLESSMAVNIPNDSAVINILLHAIYASSLVEYAPTLTDLTAAIEAMPAYGLDPALFLIPSNPLYDIIVSYAFYNPLECYALSAEVNSESLAVAVSPYLLSIDLTSITESLADRIGTRYLRRLFFLHLGRIAALKRTLLPPPELHPPTKDCGFDTQRAMSRAWTLAAAYLTWDPKPGLTNAAIQAVVEPISQSINCNECKDLFSRRVKRVLVQWSLIKRTI